MITAALTFGYEKQIKTMCSVSEMEQEKRNTVPLFHFSRITSRSEMEQNQSRNEERAYEKPTQSLSFLSPRDAL